MSRIARASRTTSGSSASPRDIRLQRDLDELNTSGSVSLSFPDPANLTVFVVRIGPETGPWKNGKFDFEFSIPGNWPIEPPKVRILTRTWHPNVTEEGSVCLSLLKENYSPVMTISHVIAGLQFLFQEPCPQSPLNTEAGHMFQHENTKFQEKVDEYIRLHCPK
jgi:ubiquitin-conjugating enzyme E2 M